MRLQDQASEIRVLDNLRTGSLGNLEGLRHEFIHGSVTDAEQVRAAVKGVDVIYHLAALVSVPESLEKPHETVEINITGLLNVLDAAAGGGVRKVVFASTAAIYGDDPVVPKTEGMHPEPKSPYAISKLAGEHYLEMYQQADGLQTCSLRFFNVFGPRQDPRGGYGAAVPIFLEKALSDEPITIFGDGEQTRDYIYVAEIASALAFAASEPISGIYNVGYGRELTINGLAREIIALTGSGSEIEYGPERPGDVKHSRASVARLMNAGWAPQFDVSGGLAITVDYARRCQKSVR
jgi:UDP-glucose 4-epimerase